MAELVDALASGASIRKDVEVRVLFWAPFLLPDVSINVRKTPVIPTFMTRNLSIAIRQNSSQLTVHYSTFDGIFSTK